MAGPQPQAPQGALASKPQQPKDAPASAAAGSEGQPVFRDWASI
jgi:hypothetical protein